MFQLRSKLKYSVGSSSILGPYFYIRLWRSQRVTSIEAHYMSLSALLGAQNLESSLQLNKSNKSMHPPHHYCGSELRIMMKKAATVI